MNKIQLILGLILVFIVLGYKDTYALVDYSEEITNGVTYLKSQQQSDGSIAGFGGTSAWATLAFVSAGEDPSFIRSDDNSLVEYLKKNQPTSVSSSTEWSREILAIVASGNDPYDFGGLNYIQGLLNHYSNDQIGDESYLNDDIFGLLALLAVGDSIDPRIIQNVANEIINNTESDYGFGWAIGGGSDIDTTAAGIQALSGVKTLNVSETFNVPDFKLKLDQVIENAITFLISSQNSDGGFPYAPGDLSNASTTAWAIMALSSVNYIGNEFEEARAFLALQQHTDGSFCWMSCEYGGDTFTTSYALMALKNSSLPIGEYTGEVPSIFPIPKVTKEPTPTIIPQAVSENLDNEGDVLSEVTQLPETGSGIEFVALSGLFVLIGVFTKILFRGAKR